MLIVFGKPEQIARHATGQRKPKLVFQIARFVRQNDGEQLTGALEMFERRFKFFRCHLQDAQIVFPFGKITSEARPRDAIAYHISTWHDLYDETFEAVRVTYDGPLTIATDEQVVVREASVDENAAPTGTTEACRKAEREPPEVAENWISDDINAGKWEGYTPPPMPQQ